MHERAQHEALHIVLTFLIGGGPAILIVCGLVDCRLLLCEEEEEELNTWPMFLWSVPPTGRGSHP